MIESKNKTSVGYTDNQQMQRGNKIMENSPGNAARTVSCSCPMEIELRNREP